MKNSTIRLASIVLWSLLSVGILLAAGAGFLYSLETMWEGGWGKGEAIEGPDGYTYCVMYEDGLMQDPKTKLIRTKNIWDDKSFEDLGQTNTTSSFMTVVRPDTSSLKRKGSLYLASNGNVFMIGSFDNIAFVYDIENEQFYEEYGDAEFSPFILLEEKGELTESDVIWLIFLVVEEYHKHLESVEYLKNHTQGESITLDYEPRCLKPDILKKGLLHPNCEVQKIARWLLEIQEKGFSNKSETINELIDYLTKHQNHRDSDTCKYIRKIFEYTSWKE